jgi:hypothetical protein
MILSTETEFPLWVLIFERIGPGSCFMVFTLAVLWRLLPAATGLLSAWRRQSEQVTSAVKPVISGMKNAVLHMERIADHVTGTRFSARDRRSTDVRNDRDNPDPVGSVAVDGSEPE